MYILYGSKTKDLEITIHSLQIMPDHVHRFVEADPTRCVAEMVDPPEGLGLAPLANQVRLALALARPLELQLLR